LCASFKSSTTSLQAWSNASPEQWIVVEESSCSDGRADQVWARIDPHWTCNTVVANASLLENPTASRILSTLLRRKKILEVDLLRLIGVTREVLRRSLRALLVAQLIENLTDQTFRLARNITFPKMEIIAFEMKLSNWKRALYQSTRYRSFSNRVFVVMPSDGSAVRERLEQFKKLGIGLITHASDGTTRVLVRPRRRKPISTHQTLMALGMLLNRGDRLV
jgi:hypothetical protein